MPSVTDELDWDEVLDGKAATPARRRYYGERHGQLPTQLASEDARRLFASVADSFDERDYFQEWFGYKCVDDGDVAGKAGEDRRSYVLRTTRRGDIWPIEQYWGEWDDALFFTAIEFVYDHISKPTEGRYHDYGNCGYHATKFDKKAGQREFREQVNEILADYGSGFQLTAAGEVEHTAATGLEPLMDADVEVLGSNIKGRVEAAVRKYRSRQSTPDDRRDAARDLFDVLEHLRDRARDVLSSDDERDLFEIANRYAMRHFNRSQKSDYDKPIFQDWMFNTLLAAIDAFARLDRERSGEST
jgi:hypothetical protein